MGKFKDLWDSSKDGNRKEQRSFLRVVIVATSIFVVFLLLKRDSVVNWIQAGFTISSQKHQIELNERKIKQLDEHIRLLTSDRDSLEEYARTKYQFAQPGDDVYVVK